MTLATSRTGIIGMQQRLVEVGRIRLGHKKKTEGGKSYPAKLEQFRLTSRDKTLLEHAAEIYGGTVRQWDDQWELFTDSDILDVAVVPGQAISQSYELWGQKTKGAKKSPVICLRRCDGTFETKSEGPCLCAQEEDQSCKPTTRLSVVLTRIPGLGVWRVESHGWNAAAELAGSVQLLEALVATRRPVRARLRLDPREQPTEEGTRKFVVPVISIDHTLEQILDTIGGEVPQAIGDGADGAKALPAGNGMTPVPVEDLPEGPRPSVADQMAQMDAPKPTSRRSNAAEPIRATGVKPRTAAEADGSDEPPGEPAGDGQGGPDVDTQRAQQIARWCREAGLDDDGRHQFLAAFSEGAYSSSKDVPPEVLGDLRARLIELSRGEVSVDVGDAGVPVLIVATEPVEGPDWSAELARTPGVGEARFLATARRLANEKFGAEVANAIADLDTIPSALTGDLLANLAERRSAAAQG